MVSIKLYLQQPIGCFGIDGFQFAFVHRFERHTPVLAQFDLKVVDGFHDVIVLRIGSFELLDRFEFLRQNIAQIRSRQENNLFGIVNQCKTVVNLKLKCLC